MNDDFFIRRALLTAELLDSDIAIFNKVVDDSPRNLPATGFQHDRIEGETRQQRRARERADIKAARRKAA